MSPPGIRFHVGPTLVARVAAQRARQVPGVTGLRPDLTQALLGVAGSVLRQTRDRCPPDGVTVTVQRGHADIEITVVSRLGYNCRDLAQAVQREVGDAVREYTGLDVTVRVTIVDIRLD